jgi:hypothetical protein
MIRQRDIGNFCTRLRSLASMKNPLILAVLFVSFPITCLRADDKPLFAPRPTKDPMAREKHCQGAGIFEMIVDKSSGKVKGVFVRSSTNDVFLDADVINTFLQWRFKPSTQSSVKIVVAFTAEKDAAFYPVGHTVHPTNHGFPAPFDEPVAPAILWQWFPELYGAAGHR